MSEIEIATPETNALIRAEFRTKAARYNAMRHHARKLERERDEARREAEKYRNLSCDSQDEADETLLPWEK